MRTFRDVMEAAPDDAGGGVLYLTGPPEPFVPEHLVGGLACGVLVVYAGAQAEARDIIAPLLAMNPPGQMIGEMPYAEMQCMLDDPPGYRNYWSAEYLSGLPDEAIDVFASLAPTMVIPSPSQHVLFPQGGAVARGGAGYPIPWRDAPWVVHPFGLWEDPADDERAVAWARSVRGEMQPWSTGMVYLNFIGDEGRDRVIAAYGRENYDRLTAIKRRYDPDNVFHLNHNIPPA